MMIVDLAKLDEADTRFEFSIPADEIDLETENVRLKSDIAASCEVSRNGSKTEIKGSVSVSARDRLHAMPDPDRALAGVWF